MKYIRTNEGIFKVIKEETLCGVKFYDYDTGEILNRIREEHTIAQADTIEELCDAYVVKVENTYMVWQILTFDQIKLHYKSEVYEVYGAIWTSKGLIYVAKLNEKGELELI